MRVFKFLEIEVNGICGGTIYFDKMEVINEVGLFLSQDGITVFNGNLDGYKVKHKKTYNLDKEKSVYFQLVKEE